MAVRPWPRLLSLWCLSAFNLSAVYCFGCGRRSYTAQSDPLEGFYFAWRLLLDRLPTKINLVVRGIIYPDAHFLYIRLRRGWIRLALIPFLQFFQLPVVVGSVLDWFLVDRHSAVIRPLCSAYFLFRRSQDVMIFHAAYLACMCVGCMEWKKSGTIHKFRVLPSSTVGQS
jgi:hypothetical protein